jgi:hypothetical protein
MINLLWEQRVVGSNPAAPIPFLKKFNRLSVPSGSRFYARCLKQNEAKSRTDEIGSGAKSVHALERDAGVPDDRLLGVQEVVGSIPAAPTSFNFPKFKTKTGDLAQEFSPRRIAHEYPDFPHGFSPYVGKRWEGRSRMLERGRAVESDPVCTCNQEDCPVCQKWAAQGGHRDRVQAREFCRGKELAGRGRASGARARGDREPRAAHPLREKERDDERGGGSPRGEARRCSSRGAREAAADSLTSVFASWGSRVRTPSPPPNARILNPQNPAGNHDSARNCAALKFRPISVFLARFRRFGARLSETFGKCLIKSLFALVIVALLSGCTRETSFGECVGLADKKDPELRYELSYWNVGIGVVFWETVIVPIVVAAKQLECPRGFRNAGGAL